MLWSALRPSSLPRSRSFIYSPRLFTATPLVAPSAVLQTERTLAQTIGRPSVRNQVLFALFGSCAVFAYAAAWTNIETDEWLEKLTRGRAPRTWPHTITSLDMKNAADLALAQELREGLKNVGVWTSGLGMATRNRIMYIWANVAQSYLNVTEGKRLCWKICLLNVGVYLAWKSRRFYPYMLRNFVHDPLSGRSITMLTSMFGSRMAVVLALNVFFLDGFGSSASFHLLQRQDRLPEGQLEATSRYHFLAFFISAGLFAALVSHITHLKVLYPRLIARLSLPSNLPQPKPDTWASAIRTPAPISGTRAFFRSWFPSGQPKLRLTSRTGGTGALYALMTLTALGFPNAEIALFYPPDYSVPIQWAVGSLVLLDIVGISRGWKFFDHIAHMGGTAFGAVYYVYGPRFWSWLRTVIADPSPVDVK
ncbi:hypothetical protein FB45DRAFT_837319 [Roridomyces roridus]|uniref:Peptidase S54 rhomboid domain-containing protein n=1 Tax=Roridomyces roridus TaxID=1738132 RepID=A0AAD7BJK8_9AGAR|nr:hypothetical protein FB45DRAFT_837319 [Roridomyces roridus]